MISKVYELFDSVEFIYIVVITIEMVSMRFAEPSTKQALRWQWQGKTPFQQEETLSRTQLIMLTFSSTY